LFDYVEVFYHQRAGTRRSARLIGRLRTTGDGRGVAKPSA
jgi:hypothetical protein